jgi:hypothetical protein
MKRQLIRPAVVALVIAAPLLVAAGIAYATIPDGGGVIHSCYQKNQGTLRVIDTGQAQTCSSSEAPLNWSQTGPQGQQGPQGPQGAQGPQGPSGSSHAYSTSNLDALTMLSPNANTITKLTLPAGDYVVWATGSVVKTGLLGSSTVGSANDVKCSLNDPKDDAITASQAEAKFDDGDAVPYVLVDTMSLPSGGTITVDCTTLDGTVVSEVTFNTLVATAVDAVN